MTLPIRRSLERLGRENAMAWWRKEASRSAEPKESRSSMDGSLGGSFDGSGGRSRTETAPDSGAGTPSQPISLEVSDILDLHSFLPREVKDVVTAYLEEARAKGFSTVRIIHGKGMGAQREMVRAILERTKFVASFQDAPAEAGGWGATVVWFASRSR